MYYVYLHCIYNNFNFYIKLLFDISYICSGKMKCKNITHELHIYIYILFLLLKSNSDL